IANCISSQPYLLNKIYNQAFQSLNTNKGHWNPETILEIVDEMWHEGCYEAQFIALSLLEATGTALLWSEECVHRLRLYRGHKCIELSTIALDIWTAIE
ncbi:MAG: hypothetical protein Q8942_00885, partial [Bacillota bacterium]|nr:hypothetical protein [Bacillota bacterium]